MSDDIVSVIPAADGPHAVQGWTERSFSPPPPRPPLERPLAALRRYKFLMIGVVLAAAGAGLIATRFVIPQYEVQTAVWIESQSPMQSSFTPIRTAELVEDQAWVELLKSNRVSDAVVRQLNLFISPEKVADAPLFENFALGERYLPGNFELTIDKSAKRWSITESTTGAHDAGTATDSIGRAIGFKWVLPPKAFEGKGDATVRFTITTLRETGVQWARRLNADLQPHSNFLHVSLQDRDPKLAARTLNTWTSEFLKVAADLKTRNVVEYAKILNDQLEFAEKSLKDAESSLEHFRVNTITLPAEGGPVAAGIQDTRDPVMKSFFDKRSQYDDLRSDVQDLERAIADASKGSSRYEAALLISSVATSPGAEALRQAFDRLYKAQADLVTLRQQFKDEYPAVQDMQKTVSTLQTQTIPSLANQLLAQLKQRQSEFDTRIQGSSKEIQQIPSRTIEEMRLRRQVTIADQFYTTLKSNAAAANLAAASSHPDLNVLDTAVAPLRPTRNTTMKILLLAIAGGFGAAIGLAILLDLVDRRIRYPDQATNDLGLVIAGTIPQLPRGGISDRSPEQLSQLVESFRSVRMHVTQGEQAPLAVAVSSPQPGDGKSFVSANLAMSFAEAGYRTVLIDGDTRRGLLQDMFGVQRSPGLTEFLAGQASFESVVHPTTHQKLSLVPAGERNPRSPELLTSASLADLVQRLRGSFDVLVFDTPPFAAGIDAYALAAAAGKLLVVLRVGKTEKRMAAAKLNVVDRIPVEVLGAVLNGVDNDGEYRYYGYVAGYAVGEAEVAGQLTS
jgi:succinoglycan biosynthesis transport protein ExoP